jgi:1-acyl-sn-glycerol-3-phosphate acyltransferase
MQNTIFETPGVNTVLRTVSVAYLQFKGWKLDGALPPDAERCVMIAAPHTSNWDLPYTLMTAFALRLHIRWLGKASLFGFPFGGVMRWLGGLSVDRSKSNNLVHASADVLKQGSGPLQLVVAPEGTRGKTRHWKSGFYYIALEAGVPILLTYLDYGRKVAGIGPCFKPTGDIEADMVEIKRFYAGIKGRNADQFEAG